ncbi:MAG: DJ-1/PfpI family protein [Solirubrobacterales bacterium]|nr:DJ-1/PfpI family protein [Solirubrobacterales bacterium]
MDAAVVIFPAFDDLDAFGPFEVLANARTGGADIAVRLVTLHPAETVPTSHGATVVPHGALDGEAAPDLLVIPGGGWNDRAQTGARAEAQRGELPAAIARLHANGTTIASVCTGAGIVAAAGLLDGREASTHHRAREELRERGVEVVDARVVDDGDVLSAGGVTAGIDLALWLVERSFGAALADAIAREMEHERRGPLHRGRNAAPVA